MLADFLPVFAILGAAALLAAVAWYTSRSAAKKLQLSKRARESLSYVVLGPVLAAILGLGVMSAAAYIAGRNLLALPPVLMIPDLTVFVELVVLAAAVRTAGAIAKRYLPSATNENEADRLLIYGVYALGLVALAYILLSSPVSPVISASLWALVNFGAGLTMTYLVAYVVNIAFKRYAQTMAPRNRGVETVLTFIRRGAVAVVVLIGISATTFTSFPNASGAVASLFIAAGFGSIVVGLAAQSALSNIFAGMIISTAQPFRLEDAVLFQNEWCWVEDIRLTFTVLKTWDNRRLVVPNQMFLNNSLVNYTLKDPSKLVIVFVQVPYDADLDKAIEIMKGEVRKHPDFVAVPGLPIVHVMEFNESGILLRLLGNAKDQPTNFQMSKDLLYSIRKEFLANGIRISYPRREVVMNPGSSLERGSRADGSSEPAGQ